MALTDDIEIRQVVTSKDLDQFIKFPFILYNRNPYWCPPLKFDERNTLLKTKNPAFDYCEAEYWLAFLNGKPVGRIAGIINHNEIVRWNKRLVRFGWIDFIDNLEISRALVTAVAKWAGEKGMDGIHGPLGFTDMDPEGMLIDGFDQISSLAAIYNYPYYMVHMEQLGFRKATDWVQFEIKVPDVIPDKVERLTRTVLRKYDLRLLNAEKASQIRPYAPKLFAMYNDAFHDLYGFTALTQKQMDNYTKQYFGFIRPEFVSIVLDTNDDVVGFGITMPSLSIALQKANGSLWPFGFIHLLRAMRKNDSIHMYLLGVRPDYQGKGVLALVYHELTRAYIREGIRVATTHPQLEDNLKAIAIWKNYDGRVNIRRRCWIREI
jgi:GNAT superfamily N-acetyltransferase